MALRILLRLTTTANKAVPYVICGLLVASCALAQPRSAVSAKPKIPSPSPYSAKAPLGDPEEILYESPEKAAQRGALEKRISLLPNPISESRLYFAGETEYFAPLFIDGLQTGDWLVDLPVSSNCVVVGTVASAKAFLTADRTWVYSDYEVKVESVLKQDSDSAVEEAGSLVTYRNGGALRFPSGKIMNFLIMGHGFPAVGSRYVLFLSRYSDLLGRYYIWKGYQLKDGLVYPLDVDRTVNGKPFSQYEGMKEDVFLEKVRGALSAKVPKKGGGK